MGKLITIYEAADILQCTHQTIINWCEKGILKRHRINGDRKRKVAMVDRDTIMSLVDDVKAMNESMARIEQMRREMEEEERKTSFKYIMTTECKYDARTMSQLQELAQVIVSTLHGTSFLMVVAPLLKSSMLWVSCPFLNIANARLRRVIRPLIRRSIRR